MYLHVANVGDRVVEELPHVLVLGLDQSEMSIVAPNPPIRAHLDPAQRLVRLRGDEALQPGAPGQLRRGGQLRLVSRAVNTHSRSFGVCRKVLLLVESAFAIKNLC